MLHHLCHHVQHQHAFCKVALLHGARDGPGLHDAVDMPPTIGRQPA